MPYTLNVLSQAGYSLICNVLNLKHAISLSLSLSFLAVLGLP